LLMRQTGLYSLTVVGAVLNQEADMDSVKGERRFAIRGGLPCLDFVNTVGWRFTDRPSEYLLSYEDLLDWGKRAGLLAPEELGALSRQAKLDPEGAQETLSRALTLREAIHRAISAVIDGEPQEESELSALNRELSMALSRLCVMPAGDAYGWAWNRSGNDGGPPLEWPLWAVTRSAAELLTSPRLGRVKVCADGGCGWVFLDESRNGSRRWCDSRDCGNRERVRRHLARKRASDA
jgi:predicted RNA-binding Zn ribbon-like protein